MFNKLDVISDENNDIIHAEKELIGYNLPKFLKSSVETDPEVISIFQDKIRDEIEEIVGLIK
ncbi:hypothetical protein JHL18_13575 [Clostridium sp. YIM B02505]|uniref:Uncharacterized protein n=1 Tax=Clostridium yunnanense TaxID=2800325 RepID=A0ABS1EQU6_9CLOT|nr:hypothetical protein [Clostridium yunnanense]MBK1811648.1 hypothetical protein [Clostridium yunnanense]